MIKLKIKRGNKSSLPQLDTGEFGLATDTNEVYIGNTSRNIQIPTLGEDGMIDPSQIPIASDIVSSTQPEPDEQNEGDYWDEPITLE